MKIDIRTNESKIVISELEDNYTKHYTNVTEAHESKTTEHEHLIKLIKSDDGGNTVEVTYNGAEETDKTPKNEFCSVNNKNHCFGTINVIVILLEKDGKEIKRDSKKSSKKVRYGGGGDIPG